MFRLDDDKRIVIPRTEMTYPGHNRKLHENAADPVKSPVDLVMADFEDACPYEFKGEASRAAVIEAFNGLDFGKKVVSVRPNNVRSPFFRDDLEAVVLGAPNRFHGIMYPKARGPEEIAELSELLDGLERRAGWKYRLQIEVLIETPQALLSAYEIATASDRMAGLVFGIADFAANLGIRDIVANQNRNFHYAKQAMVVAAKAAGLHAIDNVFLRLVRKDDSPEQKQDVENALREKNEGSAAIGMDGTWVIHPQQAEIANACYSVSKEHLDYAKRVTELYHQNGGGAMADPENGEMIDEATIKMTLMDLARAAQAGTVSDAYVTEQARKSAEVTGYDILELTRRAA